MADSSEGDLISFKASLSLSTEEIAQLEDKHMLSRVLRADKGNEKSAAKRLRKTLAWRQEFGVSALRSCFRSPNPSPEIKALEETLLHENTTGKIYIRGKDRRGRAAVIMRPQNENTHAHDGNLQHLVYMLEKGIECSKRNTLTVDEATGEETWEEKVCIIFDYNGYSMRDAVPLKTAKGECNALVFLLCHAVPIPSLTLFLLYSIAQQPTATIHILQAHYPERLYRAYFVNAPWFFRGFMKLVNPFIDAASREKFRFVSTENAPKIMGADFDLSELEPFCGGSARGYGEKNADYDAELCLRKLDFDVSLPLT